MILKIIMKATHSAGELVLHFNKVKKYIIILTIVCCSITTAQEVNTVFEISPNTGFMDGGAEFGIDASINYRYINLEFSGAQVIGETADLYPLCVNLIFNFAKSSKIIPYGLVGAGLFLTVPTTAIGSQTVSTLGMNFGGGVRYYFNNSVGLRLGVSQYLTSVKNRRDNFEELLIFQEVTFGVIFVFE